MGLRALRLGNDYKNNEYFSRGKKMCKVRNMTNTAFLLHVAFLDRFMLYLSDEQQDEANSVSRNC